MLTGSRLGEAWALCFVANCFVGAMYRAIEADAGVTRPEFVVLLCVGEFDGLVAQDVAEMSGLPRNTISRGVNRLLKDGHLARASATGGQRDQFLTLTATGKALRTRLAAFPERQRARMIATISESDRRSLERVLLKLAFSAEDWSADGGAAN